MEDTMVDYSNGGHHAAMKDTMQQWRIPWWTTAMKDTMVDYSNGGYHGGLQQWRIPWWTRTMEAD